MAISFTDSIGLAESLCSTEMTSGIASYQLQKRNHVRILTQVYDWLTCSTTEKTSETTHLCITASTRSKSGLKGEALRVVLGL